MKPEEEKKEYNRQYYVSHPNLKEEAKKRAENNRERNRAANSVWSKANPENNRARTRKYRKLHPEKSKEYYDRNKDRLLALQKERRRSNPEKWKLAWRRYKYGITEEQYNEKFLTQEGKCAICCKVMETPHVDHNHVTQENRGLLCANCNRGLGMFFEDVDILNKAINYIQKHKS